MFSSLPLTWTREGVWGEFLSSFMSLPPLMSSEFSTFLYKYWMFICHRHIGFGSRMVVSRGNSSTGAASSIPQNDIFSYFLHPPFFSFKLIPSLPKTTFSRFVFFFFFFFTFSNTPYSLNNQGSHILSLFLYLPPPFSYSSYWLNCSGKHLPIDKGTNKVVIEMAKTDALKCNMQISTLLDLRLFEFHQSCGMGGVRDLLMQETLCVTVFI